MKKLITLAIAMLISIAAWSQITGKTFDQLPTMTTVDGTTWFVTLDGSPKVWKKFQGNTLRQFLHSKVTQITTGANLSSIASPFEGDLAVNAAKDSIWIRDDSAWIVFAAGTGGGSGSVPTLAEVLTASNNASGKRITSLGYPISSSDAVTKNYADSIAAVLALQAAQESQYYAVQVSQLALDTADARRNQAIQDTADVLRTEITAAGNAYVKKTELGTQFDIGTGTLKLAQQGAAAGQVMKWSGSAWLPGTDDGGGSVTGITSLNMLTPSSQYFATGTTGTDFNITSSTATHTFNIPTASASARGLLSSSDYSNFTSAYADRLKWDGGATGLNATTARTSLGLGSLAVLNSASVAVGGTGLTSLGTANQLLRVNAGGTALEYFTPGYLTSNTGDWTGTFDGQEGTYYLSRANHTGTTPVTGGGTGLGTLGTANQLLRVNAGGTALEYFTPGYLTSNTGDWTGTFDGQEGTYYLSRANHTGTTPVAGGGTGLTALGTANQLLRVNAGATALEYFSPTYLTSEVDGNVTNEGALTVGAGTATTSVISSNTTGSTAVTLSAGSNITLSETGNTITIAASGGTAATDLTFSGTASPVTLNSSTGTDVTFTAGSGVGLSANGTNINIALVPIGDWTGTFDGQEGTYYLSRTNHTGTTPVAGGGTGLTALGTANQLLRVNAGATALEYFTPTYLTSEVDGSVTNEGALTVGAGTATTSVISSNTTGSTAVTLSAGSNITLSESGNTITIAASSSGDTDDQTLSFTPSTATLSISEGNSVGIGFGGLAAGGTYATGDLMHLYDISGTDYESITLGSLGPVLAGYTSIKALNDVDDGTPTTGQVLKWNGTSWAFSSDLTGTGGMSSWNWGLSGNTSAITDGSTVTLSAGSGISLSKTGNNIGITATLSNTNIYNTSSSLLSDRSMWLNGYAMTFDGSINDIKINSSGFLRAEASAVLYSEVSSNNVTVVGTDKYVAISSTGSGTGTSPTVQGGQTGSFSGIDFNTGAVQFVSNSEYGSGPSGEFTANGFLKLYKFPSTTQTAIATMDASNQVNKLAPGNHVSIGAATVSVVPATVSVSSPTNAQTITPDLSSLASRVYNLNVTGLTSLTFGAPTNPLNGGVYTFHLRGVGSLSVTWNTIFKDPSGTALGSKSYTSSTFLTCYYDGTNAVYYCQ